MGPDPDIAIEKSMASDPLPSTAAADLPAMVNWFPSKFVPEPPLLFQCGGVFLRGVASAAT